MTRPKPVETFLPLKPVDYLILRVLWDGERHGYGIVQDIAERTAGQTQLVPGNFYAILRRLMSDGLLEEAGDRERRKYYRITALGTRVAAAEARRMRDLVKDAERQHVIEETS